MYQLTERVNGTSANRQREEHLSRSIMVLQERILDDEELSEEEQQLLREWTKELNSLRS